MEGGPVLANVDTLGMDVFNVGISVLHQAHVTSGSIGQDLVLWCKFYAVTLLLSGGGMIKSDRVLTKSTGRGQSSLTGRFVSRTCHVTWRRAASASSVGNIFGLILDCR